MVRYCLLLLAMLFSSTAYAAPPAQEKCADDRGSDRCSAQNETLTRRQYDLLSKEEMSAKGAYVRRAMFVDGYGRDVLAVSFIREKGRDAYVEVRVPKAEKEKHVRMIVAPVSFEQWNDVGQAGRYFDRDLVAPPASEGVINVCLHGWTVIAETVDPARLNQNSLPATAQPPELRSKTQSACGEGLTVDYGFKLADLALAALPMCQSVPIEGRRNTVMALNFCQILSGDRSAAGQASSVANKIDSVVAINRNDPTKAQAAVEQVIITASPSDKPAPGRITRARRTELAAMLVQGDLYVHGVEGVDADHAIIDMMQVQRGDTNNVRQPQRVLKLFTSREGGAFRIYNIEATPFATPPNIK